MIVFWYVSSMLLVSLIAWALGDWHGRNRLIEDTYWGDELLLTLKRRIRRPRHRRPVMRLRMQAWWQKTRPRTPQEVSGESA